MEKPNPTRAGREARPFLLPEIESGSRRRFLSALLAAATAPPLTGVRLAFGKNEQDATNEELRGFRQPHMGTEFTIRVSSPKERKEALEAAVARAFARVAELNQICSDYLPESEINDLARAPSGEPFETSPDLFRILDRAVLLWQQSGGAFDVTAGPLVRLWRLTRKNRQLPDEEQIARALARTGSHFLELDPLRRTVTKHCEGMLFDLGGIAKGYAADAALAVLREDGFPRAIVAASGDIVAGDAPAGLDAWRVGIETFRPVAPNGHGEPDGGSVPARELPVVALTNHAISTSGDLRQYVEIDGVRYSHIVSTKTGLGLTERIAASVTAPDAFSSDSLATATVLLGEKDGLQFIENQRGVEGRIVTLRDGEETVLTTDGFPRFQIPQEGQAEAPLSAP